VRPVSFVSDLPRAWVSIQVPGTPSPERYATYVAYGTGSLPAAPEHLELLDWLAEAPRHPDDYMATRFDAAVRDLDWDGVAGLLTDPGTLPEDFLLFLSGGSDLRNRLRSATDCYFDLGDTVVDVEGGRLLHLVSDSQWVFHWLLYVGDDGRSAVVGSTYPVGFRLGPDDQEAWSGETPAYVLVAGSFAEFAWRWWMDNEIFYKKVVERVPLTAAEREYVNRYGTSRQL
jgi:hypothetical protein